MKDVSYPFQAAGDFTGTKQLSGMLPPGSWAWGGGRGPAGKQSQSGTGFDSPLFGAELINGALI